MSTSFEKRRLLYDNIYCPATHFLSGTTLETATCCFSLNFTRPYRLFWKRKRALERLETKRGRARTSTFLPVTQWRNFFFQNLQQKTMMNRAKSLWCSLPAFLFYYRLPKWTNRRYSQCKKRVSTQIFNLSHYSANFDAFIAWLHSGHHRIIERRPIFVNMSSTSLQMAIERVKLREVTWIRIHYHRNFFLLFK